MNEVAGSDNFVTPKSNITHHIADMEFIWINKVILNSQESEKMLISLDDEFSLHHCSSPCHVALRNDHLYYETARIKERISEHIKVKDVFSCSVSKEPNKCKQKFYIYLTINTYPIVRGHRQKKKLTFLVHKGKTWEDNYETAQKWKYLILEAMYNIPGGLKSTTNYENIRTTRPLFGGNNIDKKYVVYVNPKSGTGLSNKIYKHDVKPMLSEAGITHDVVLTTDQNAAYYSVQALDLDKINGIVVISGDGLLYEIYNGLLARKDWYDAISFPVSIIPGGSGNGLATSVGYVWSEPYLKDPVLVSTLNILNPILTPMDLVIVNTVGRKRLLSFLSISIGLLADVDIDSEYLRPLGDIRFSIWSIKNLIWLRTFRCRLSYKLARKMRCQRKGCSAAVLSPLTGKSNCNVKDITREQVSPIQPDDIQLPNEIPSGNYMREGISTGSEPMKGNSPSIMKGTRCLNCPSGVDDDDDELYPDYAKILVDKSFTDPDFDVLGQPVPSNWHVVEDDFILIFSAMKPFMGKEGFISPMSSLSDGIMYMWVMRKGAPRLAVLNFLLSISHGVEPTEYLERIPVSAFRIEPLNKSGNLVVDGEVIEYGPIQASVLPGKGSLMIKPL